MLKLIVPLAALLLGGAQAPPAPPAAQDTVASVPRISAADAKKAVDAGKAILVDVRGAVAYQEEHAKGAIHMPTYEIATRMSELPKDKQIITYCT
ncbi:MAG TPA: rhodanese-like domain-containing protein [Thermoanaerobaculia bacterium]|nr:rhodanese-like domain-containing protein [Thermoanaerobaculia bacterium]